MVKRQYLFLALAFLVVFLVAIIANVNTANAETMECEPKIVYKNYDNLVNCKKVIVVIDKYHSEPNKEYKKDYFNYPERIKSITDMTYKKDLEHFKEKQIESFRQILLIELYDEDKESLIKFIEANIKINGVMSIEANRGVKCIEDEDDTNYITSFNQEDLWGLYGEHGINAAQAREFEGGDVDVKVGIIDNGIISHQDFASNLMTGYDADNENNITNDTTSLHGTKIAGIIASSSNSLLSTAVSRDVKLYPIQLGFESGLINNDALIRAFTWAEDNDLDIVNCSFGWYDDELSPGIQTAIQMFQGLLVCSAGNESLSLETNCRYFSELSYNCSTSNRVVSVGAINQNGNKRVSSNYGQNRVSIFAPGTDIITTADNNQYCKTSGTSYAAPMVSGVAALIFSIYADNAHMLGRAEIAAKTKTLILYNSRYSVALDGLCEISGELDAYGALVKTPYLTAANVFGYLGSWYTWRGQLNLKLPDDGWKYNSNGDLVLTEDMTLSFGVSTYRVYNAWKEINATISYEVKDSDGDVVSLNDIIYNTTVSVNLVSVPTYSNRLFTINTASLPNDTYTLYLHCSATRDGDTHTQTKSFKFIVNVPSSGGSCITTGSLITLADGSQVAVENLTGNEQLLVWDMYTGTFSSAPILFIDVDPTTTYEVIKLGFSDGTIVNVIDEHAFFDITLNKYVFLRADASQYIGHLFSKYESNGNNMLNTQAMLVSVTIEQEVTTAYSPVTYGHLCYYVNGMLSMPGNTESFINIFEVDS